MTTLNILLSFYTFITANVCVVTAFDGLLVFFHIFHWILNLYSWTKQDVFWFYWYHLTDIEMQFVVNDSAIPSLVLANSNLKCKETTYKWLVCLKEPWYVPLNILAMNNCTRCELWKWITYFETGALNQWARDSSTLLLFWKLQPDVVAACVVSRLLSVTG